jgi:fumarate reductase flavoprotein subunit
MKTQIVVIGGGGAGLSAAVAAAEKGAEVIVLEKRAKPGGNARMAEGLLAAESDVQKRAKIDARKDDLFKIAMDFDHWQLNPRLIRAFLDKSGDTIKWLENKGLKFRVEAYYLGQTPIWHCFTGKGRGGRYLIRAYERECKRLGVTVLNKTGAKRLITDKNGKPTGVIAEKEGSEFRIDLKCVIIATGGYGGNTEMLKRYAPLFEEDMECYGLPHMGDGINMAIEIGAATEGLGNLHLGGPDFVGAKSIRMIAFEPYTLWINNRGERFIDEAAGLDKFIPVNGLMRQPGRVSYAIFDEAIKRSVEEEGVINGQGLSVPSLTRLEGIDRDIMVELKKGVAGKSASWDGIAEWIGISPDTLKITIDEYNACADRGYDNIFNKERRYLLPLRTPPYYALKCRPIFLETIGGIKINHHMSVLDGDDYPIPGLFAAGIDTGGWCGKTYNPHFSGAALGFSVNSGRIAGENAAGYVKMGGYQ